MIGIGARDGASKVTALLTDMDQPLGPRRGQRARGDRGGGDAARQGARRLHRGHARAHRRDARAGGQGERRGGGAGAAAARASRTAGACASCSEIVKAQGGDRAPIGDCSQLPQREGHGATWSAPAGGFVTGIDSEAVGLAAVALGAGRQRTDSLIDPAVGFTLLRRRWATPVKRRRARWCACTTTTRAPLEDVKERLLAAYRFGPQAPAPRPLVLERLE